MGFVADAVEGAFDLIVDLFYSTERTLEILQTNTFDEFRNNF